MEDEEEVVVVDDKLFVEENGAPTRFFLHPSIKQAGARLALESKIEQYGGAISPTDAGSNVILVNPKQPSGDPDKIRRAYKTHSDPELHGVYVEAMAWVNNMVKTGRVMHHFIQKGMGGAIRGDRERTAFTEEDDYRLARYLAVLIPDKSDGGRLGTNVYRSLMENHETLPDEYYWVLNHTWQSWRERYKKNQGWFDERIAELAAQIKPAQHQKYELSRKATRSATQRNKGYDMYSPEPEEEEEEEEEEVDQLEEEEEEEDAASRKRPISGSGSQRAAKKMRIESSPPPHSDGAQDVSTASKGKEKALPEDDDDDYHSDNSLFDGPSFDSTQQTSPLRPTQATLVGTAPSPSDPPRASPEPEVVPEPPRRQQPARGKRISAARPIDPRPAPPTRQTARKVAESPTPYRSTRARSRDLEPYVADINAVTRKNRPKGKKKALESLEEERRVEGERDNISQGTREPEGAAETQEVEDILMAANEQSGASDGGNIIEDVDVDVDVDRMPPPRSTVRPALRQRQSPLETDDNQTDLALRRQQVSSPVLSAREVLRDLVGPRLSSRAPESLRTSRAPSLAISSRFAQNSPPDDIFGGSRRGSSVQVQVPSVDPSNPLYDPRAPAFSRKASGSSAESFPRAGTRAKEIKHEIKEQEKSTPFRPLRGTRALERVVNTPSDTR